jgi:hypothetical protein
MKKLAKWIKWLAWGVAIYAVLRYCEELNTCLMNY